MIPLSDDDEQLHIQNDLIDYADVDRAVSENASDGILLGRRKDWVDAALPDADVLETATSGGYQGKWAFVAKVDGYWWLHSDYYGSCGHCDSFIDRKKAWLEDALRDAYCFESVGDALAYLATTDAVEWKYGDGTIVRNEIAGVLENYRDGPESGAETEADNE